MVRFTVAPGTVHQSLMVSRVVRCGPRFSTVAVPPGQVALGGVHVEDDVPRRRLRGRLPLLQVERLLSPGQQSGGDRAAARDFALLAQRIMDRLEQGRQTVIAAVNGYALGGGCELAMACDMRLASENARFGQPEINLGIIPGWAGTQRLPRLVGRGRALELLLTGDLIDAAEAYRIGLVNRLLPAAELLPAARELARKIAGKGQVAVRLCREAVRHGLEMDRARGAAFEADLFGLCFATDDQKEGMQAFLEKRKPQFKDA